ncbi:MAG: heavy metal-binding domain-containing protein [Bacteroidia bacterium]|nr:heavy metal-binding domain-containing protein [Bacteroidia bacterium]MDW8345860.1 heavy metal-binding domain-containing protein [Bacteroidia bacterium]
MKIIVTTANDVPGYKIVKNLGVIRGITVRSRGLGGNFIGGLQTIFGGRISAYLKLCEEARQEAYAELIHQAELTGANAVIGMRYESNEVISGVTEVLAYGTAVLVEPIG